MSFPSESKTATKTDPVLKTARQLRASGNSESALTEYLRYLFFHPAAPNITDVYFEMGQVYLQLNQWDEAKEAWRQSIKLASADSLKNARRVTLAIQSIAHQNYSLAVLELLKVVSFGKQRPLRRKAQFYLGVAEVYLLDFNQAEAAFRRYFSNVPSFFGRKTWTKLLVLLKRGEALRPKSDAVAKWLSTFLPGLGQLYAGDVKNALNALILNGAIGYGVGQAFFQRDYIDAILEGSLLFQRYYLGNRFHAARLASERPLQRKRKIAAKILDVLHAYLKKTAEISER